MVLCLGVPLWPEGNNSTLIRLLEVNPFSQSGWKSPLTTFTLEALKLKSHKIEKRTNQVVGWQVQVCRKWSFIIYNIHRNKWKSSHRYQIINKVTNKVDGRNNDCKYLRRVIWIHTRTTTTLSTNILLRSFMHPLLGRIKTSIPLLYYNYSKNLIFVSIRYYKYLSI